jgi:hypothetical protein
VALFYLDSSALGKAVSRVSVPGVSFVLKGAVSTPLG